MCILCGGCVDICPEKCLELVSLDRIGFEPETVRHIRDNQELFGVEFDEVAARKPRVLEPVRESIDYWGSAVDPRKAAKGEIEALVTNTPGGNA